MSTSVEHVSLFVGRFDVFEVAKRITDNVAYFLPRNTDMEQVCFLVTHLYSSKFDEYLAVRSQFDSDHGVDSSTPTSCQSATFVRPLLHFIVLCFLRKKIINNAAFHHRRGDVYSARLMDLRNR